MSEAPTVLFSGVTVGDVASWVDSLLVAALLRFGAASFTSVLDTRHKQKQLAYTFQARDRGGGRGAARRRRGASCCCRSG